MHIQAKKLYATLYPEMIDVCVPSNVSQTLLLYLYTNRFRSLKLIIIIHCILNHTKCEKNKVKSIQKELKAIYVVEALAIYIFGGIACQINFLN